MNVVDSSAWLEYFADGPNAARFADAIEQTEHLLVPTLCLFEVYKRLYQQLGESGAINGIAMMQRGRIVDVTASLALEAARNSIDFKLPLADSIVLTTARAHGAILWTQDADFERIDGVRYFKKRTD
ncbi:MAG: type II toxin-antitoxin system VapC family toxin [Alphaproteobacteria bacterium]|nr:type II toxin-antitoxin system VapC family toxin [Alphaproteobacteria bacterium]